MVKVGDFGISKMMSTYTKNEGAKTVLGTPYYISPEMVSRSRQRRHGHPRGIFAKLAHGMVFCGFLTDVQYTQQGWRELSKSGWGEFAKSTEILQITKNRTIFQKVSVAGPAGPGDETATDIHTHIIPVFNGK